MTSRDSSLAKRCSVGTLRGRKGISLHVRKTASRSKTAVVIRMQKKASSSDHRNQKIRRDGFRGSTPRTYCCIHSPSPSPFLLVVFKAKGPVAQSGHPRDDHPTAGKATARIRPTKRSGGGIERREKERGRSVLEAFDSV